MLSVDMAVVIVSISTTLITRVGLLKHSN